MGFDSALAYHAARCKSRFGTLISVALIVSPVAAICTSVIFLVVWQLPISPWFGIPVEYFYACAVLTVLTYVNNSLFRVFSGKLQITVINVAEVITAAVQIVAISYVIYKTHYGLPGVVISIVAGQAAGFVFLVMGVIKSVKTYGKEESRIQVSKSKIRELWSYGRWNYLLMLVNSLLDELPMIMLKGFWSTLAVGYYSSAFKICFYPRYILVPFARMLFPYTAASSNAEARRRTNMLTKYAFMALLVPAIILMLMSEQVIGILYGPEFIVASKVLVVLLPTMILFPITKFFAIHVAAAGQPKQVFTTSLLALLVTIGPSVYLIKSYGPVGAGAAVSVSYLFLAMSRIYIYVKITKSSLKEVLLPSMGDLRLIFKRMGFGQLGVEAK
jgi:O-antigen/teichoic acid export membrane protein